MGQTVLESATVPEPSDGRWAVAVSGGADSVALLWLLRDRSSAAGLHLHAAHLNHELRGEESEGDARFVAELSTRLGLPCTIGLRHEVEAKMPAERGLPKNPSARYRAARLAFFRQVVTEQQLDGVIFAHHADDQAETVLQRLLRGSGWAGLCGMRARSTIGGLLVLRPMLGARRAEVREYLSQIGQPWREDSSNASDKYFRNRLRLLLAERGDLTAELLRLSEACSALRRWVAANAPRLEQTFAADELAELPAILARTAAGRWLADFADGANSPRSIDLLLEMASDAAMPARRQVSAKVTLCRRRGRISAQSSRA
jgi:tRNA(Ile)-lysidine synthetase-like protein